MVAVASHYDLKSHIQRSTRPDRVRTVNDAHNDAKRSLIREYVPRGSSVLDLACGRGGDVWKYSEADVGRYVGVDVSGSALEEHAIRSTRAGFAATLMKGDIASRTLAQRLSPIGPFDAVSCQFALHYAFYSETAVRQVASTVAAVTSPRGIFFGITCDEDTVFRVHDESFRVEPIGVNDEGMTSYNFTFGPYVTDCPEYVVRKDLLIDAFEREGFRPLRLQPLRTYMNERRVPHGDHPLTRIYTVFAFERARDASNGSIIALPENGSYSLF